MSSRIGISSHCAHTCRPMKCGEPWTTCIGRTLLLDVQYRLMVTENTVLIKTVLNFLDVGGPIMG